MHGQDTVTKFYAHMRKDRDSLLQELIGSPEVASCCSTFDKDIVDQCCSFLALFIRHFKQFMCSMCRLMACV